MFFSLEMAREGVTDWESHPYSNPALFTYTSESESEVVGFHPVPRRTLQRVDSLTLWDNPAVLSEYSKAFNAAMAGIGSNLRTRIKRIADNPKWRVERMARFLSGELIPPPWADQDGMYERRPNHLASVDKKKGEISFFGNETHGRIGKLTVVKASRYIANWIPTSDDEEAEKYRAACGNGSIYRFGLARSEDEIKCVYVTGPRSCMSHDNWDIHPSIVYASPDMGVAYLEREQGDETRIVARSVVSVKNKVFGRTYGDTLRIEKYLQDSGFKSGRSSDFAGNRLLKIEDDCGRIVCPYLDVHHSVEIEDDCLIIGGSIDARSESGYLYDSWTCPNCGDSWHDAESGEVMDRHGDSWCHNCWEGVDCHTCGERTPPGELSETVAGNLICDDCAVERTCDDCGDVTSRRLTNGLCNSCDPERESA